MKSIGDRVYAGSPTVIVSTWNRGFGAPRNPSGDTRRSNVGPYPRPVSIPNDGAITRLVGALIVEQNEEWHLTRRYMSHESLAKVIQPDPEKNLLETRDVA